MTRTAAIILLLLAVVAAAVVGGELQDLRLENASLRADVKRMGDSLAEPTFAEEEAWDSGLEYGTALGAKIALSDTDYRLDEVRGDCQDLFNEDECLKCHDSSWLE